MFATGRGAGAPPASARAIISVPGPATTPRRETRRVTFSPFLPQGLPRTATRNPANAARVRASGALALELVKLAVARRERCRVRRRAPSASPRAARSFAEEADFRRFSSLRAAFSGTSPADLLPRDASAFWRASPRRRRAVAGGKAPRPSVASKQKRGVKDPVYGPRTKFFRPPGSGRLPWLSSGQGYPAEEVRSVILSDPRVRLQVIVRRERFSELNPEARRSEDTISRRSS